MKKLVLISSVIFIMTKSLFAIPTGDIATIANNVRFQSRVNYYINQAALAVLSEDPQTASHALRVSFAKSIVTGPVTLVTNSGVSNQNSLQRYSLEVLTNVTIASEAKLIDAQGAALPDFNIPDSDLQFAVNSLFNAFAGVSN